MENNPVKQPKNGEPYKKLTREEKLSEAKLEDQVIKKIRLFFLRLIYDIKKSDRCLNFFFFYFPS